MASPSSSFNAQKFNQNEGSSPEKPNKNTDTSSSSSRLPPLPPNIYQFSNQNYESGFQTAPSSPPPEPAAPPPTNSTSFPADSSVSAQTGSVTEISPPPSPETTKPSGPVPARLHGRDALPSHHLLKVKSFSTLSKALEKFSSEFEAGGYKWSELFYVPGWGQEQRWARLYFCLLGNSGNKYFPAGWEVNAIFSFFVFDQIRNKYVGTQDATVRRFHCMKTQWGVVKFIDLKTFKNPYNGYLVNDTYSFGVEVFVVKTRSKSECLSLINNPATHMIGWNFSSISKTLKYYETDFFVGGDYKWRVFFYPKGYQQEGNKINNIISLYLHVDSSTLPADTKLLVQYTFRLEDKKNGNHFERSDCKLFGSAARGFREFMSMTKFKDPENGFLVGDTCLIEVEFKVLGSVTLE